MDFRGVDGDMITNARALNAAFLALATGPGAPAGLAPDLVEQLGRLDVTELQRLAGVPFLLYSVAIAKPMVGASAPLCDSSDLFDDRMTTAESRLVTATLSLLWCLARMDRHGACFLAGISRRWCDDIAGAPLYDVLDTTRHFETLIVPRCGGRRAFWEKLFVSASDQRLFVRRAARHSALQCLLTELRDDTCLPVATAACRKPTRSRRRVD